jgi:23S rRNA pseudouridine2605 synthase
MNYKNHIDKNSDTGKKGKNKTNQSVNTEMRLARFMSLAGVASRRKCEEIILTGVVTVNGKIITEPGTKVKSGDKVLLNGKILLPDEKVYIMLNKPKGYLCSAKDPHAEKTIFELVDIPGKRIFNAGRLDLNSEGLLILTNDGDYAEKLMHPKYGTTKKYRVRTTKELSKKALESIREGIYDDGEFLKPESVRKVKEKEYIFTMTEGKKREIRRLVASEGIRITLLRRTSIGSLFLGKLKSGEWRHLTEQEIDLSLKTQS